MSRQRRRNRAALPLVNEPLWYKDAILYEVPVRAFRDSNGDGIGDFKGLVEKLDYLQDLGVTALWLLPFYPSPLRDDGYDIADYKDVHSRYGTLEDFQLFLREAHRRGLRVITELVVNHTSDQHPWFQRARHAPPGDPARAFYVWSDTDTRYREARIIFKDFETSNWSWDPVAGAYYWHRFYSHQPDLNYDNPRVWEAVFDALDFWLAMGIDGLRLDAIPYLCEREGTNCENLPETHAFLRALRKHVDEKFPNRMLLAEANQWPEDAVAYFGDGDECNMAFHFPVMPRLFMAIRMEDRLPILDILQQTPPIPPTCQWALFLRNHDELTLEMVTDEDRDYMYRVYARDPQARINLGIRRRLAPLLENQRPKIELMNGLLFSLPGTPVLYYGDEIGMGDNIYIGDRNGVRTPMQWTSERNAGFSRANPQGLYLPVIIDPEYHYQAVNVEVQQNNSHSLLWWTKRLIDLRKHHPAFGRGSITFLSPDNSKVLAFVRSHQPGNESGTASGEQPLPSSAADDILLVVANLSRFTQYAELDLGAYKGWTPVELLGRTPFPVVSDRPYFLTLGPHAFYWFVLERQHGHASVPASDAPLIRPTFAVPDTWQQILQGELKEMLQDSLPVYLKTCPWFGPKACLVEAAMILETIPVTCAIATHPTAGHGGPVATATVQVALIQVEYSEGEAETCVLPLAFAGGSEAARIQSERPRAVVAFLQLPTHAERKAGSLHASAERTGILYDPVGEPMFTQTLLDAIRNNRHFKRSAGELVAVSFLERAADRVAPAEQSLAPAAPCMVPTVTVKPGESVIEAPYFAASGAVLLRHEQHNSSVVFDGRYILKLFRHMVEGINPEVEMDRFLAEKTTFTHTPRLAGMLEYRRGWGESMTLAVLHEYVAHQSNGWHYCVDALGRYFEQALARRDKAEEPSIPTGPVLALVGTAVPALAQETIGPVLEAMRLLGQRTGELHLALASCPADPAFTPEPFTTLYQRSLYQSLRSRARRAFLLLRHHLNDLPEDVRAEARQLESREEVLLQRVRTVFERKITAQRIRNHGDYTLREVLYTGRDFLIIDFEGQPSRPLSDRRRKYTALRDVAVMLRSIHYAVLFALHNGGVRREDRPMLAPWARLWYVWVSAAFLEGYLATASRGSFLPQAAEEQEALLDFYLVKRAINELGYELGRDLQRPAIPIRGLLQMLETKSGATEPHP